MTCLMPRHLDISLCLPGSCCPSPLLPYVVVLVLGISRMLLYVGFNLHRIWAFHTLPPLTYLI